MGNSPNYLTKLQAYETLILLLSIVGFARQL